LKEHSEDTELVDCFVTWSYIIERSKKPKERRETRTTE
jgi:hypothetical protein